MAARIAVREVRGPGEAATRFLPVVLGPDAGTLACATTAPCHAARYLFFVTLGGG